MTKVQDLSFCVHLQQMTDRPGTQRAAAAVAETRKSCDILAANILACKGTPPSQRVHEHLRSSRLNLLKPRGSDVHEQNDVLPGLVHVC